MNLKRGFFARKSLVTLFLITVGMLSAARADEVPMVRLGYMQGSGGSVGTKGALSGGFESEFWRSNDSNLALSVSADVLIEPGADGANRPVIPALVNLRWYNNKGFQGFYVAGGVGAAVPVGRFHGGATLAWEGSLGYLSTDRYFLELRYIGKSAQSAVYNGVLSSLNNQFIGGFVGKQF